MARIEDFDEKLSALEDTLGGTEAVVAAFDNELKRMQSTVADTNREVGTLSRGLSRGLKNAFDDLVFDGQSLASALDGLAQSMVNAAYSAALRPVTNHFGGILASGVSGLFPGAFTGGGSLASQAVAPFAAASGARATAPAKAVAVAAASAGARPSDTAGRAINVVINVSTPDADGFRRSKGQIASEMSRALGRAERNR